VPSPRYPERGRSYFPDRVSAAIDEERRRLFEKLGEMYEGHFILTATYFPPLLIQKKFVELLFDDEARPSTATQRTTAILDEFERNIESIENRLSMAFSLRRLKSAELQNEDGRHNGAGRILAVAPILHHGPFASCHVAEKPDVS
jgi:type IV secretion system protein TrbE